MAAHTGVALRAVLTVSLAVFAGSGCSLMRGGFVPAREAIGADVDDLDPASLAIAAERTAEALANVEPRLVRIGSRKLRTRDLEASAREVARIANEETDAAGLTRRLAEQCRAVPATEPAKVTGYFEPVLAARRRPDARFRYPLYALPSAEQLKSLERELGRVPTRADIDGRGALDGLGLELAWTDDAVARFFLHVQGSGRLDFGDGQPTRVGFAGTNGLAYRSIGALMLEEGLLEPGGASAMSMRRWLAEHPDRRDALLFENPRYVFFRDTGAEGPFGALGAELTAGRSIAADDRHVPRGVLVWLRTTRPVVDADGRLAGKEPLTRFAFAQDAGAAIEGPARVDLFTGSGDEAGLEAGGMNEAGELYVLLCRDPWRPAPGPVGPPSRSWQHLRAHQAHTGGM